MPLLIASRDTAPYGMGVTPSRGPIGRMRNTLLSAIAARTVFPRAERLGQQINRELNGKPLPFPVLDWPRHAEAILQFTVQSSSTPAPMPRPPCISSVRSPPPVPRAPLPPWWDELDGSRPVVHVTQGTIANRDYRQIIAPTLEAFADDDVLVSVSTGGRPVDTLPPLPSNARAAEYLPYDELLPKTDVFVTNGGYGGVQYALRYGVPIVTSSGQEDKPEVAGRIAWSGVGRRIKTETPTSASRRQRGARRCSPTPDTGVAHSDRGRWPAPADASPRRNRRRAGGGRPLRLLAPFASRRRRGDVPPSQEQPAPAGPSRSVGRRARVSVR